MPWYSGPTLLEVLETVEIQRVVDTQPMRFPVQYVNRHKANIEVARQLFSKGQVALADLVETRFAVVHQIHFVYCHHQVFDPQRWGSNTWWWQ